MDLKIFINQKVNWESKDSYYFFNPKQSSMRDYVTKLPRATGRIYVTSSGGRKIIGLSKKAFLTSARSVNEHLGCTPKDRWLDVLPFFHVASLSISARSFCGDFTSLKMEEAWSAKVFQKELQDKKITLTSLVPAQVYDLVKWNLSAPSSLRTLIVGGGGLAPSLYEEACRLKWPLLPSYGLTEMASQVATAPLSSLKEKSFPKLKILSHVKVRSPAGFIELHSPSLMEGFFDLDKKQWRSFNKKEDWFQTQDRGFKEGSFLTIKGRSENQIKILGELVDLDRLSQDLESFFKEGCLVATPCERNGFQIDLITTSLDFNRILKIISRFDQKVLPFEKIKNVYLVKEIPQGNLFKIKQKWLKKQIGF